LREVPAKGLDRSENGTVRTLRMLRTIRTSYWTLTTPMTGDIVYCPLLVS
jgi:hypothetical protein